MVNSKVVSHQEWLKARVQLLEKEKELTRLRDQINQQRRQLPWFKLQKQYQFNTVSGVQTLSDLFSGQRQLIVYHFMFASDWQDGCVSCSFFTDGFSEINTHLNNRDINLVLVSNAPLQKLQKYKQRMAWNLNWVSAADSDFNRDFYVAFSGQEMVDKNMYYNYRFGYFPVKEAPGVSVFYKNDNGEIFHTYSCYARGLDILNSAYNFMDLTPLGRNEQDLEYPMAWLRRKDEY